MLQSTLKNRPKIREKTWKSLEFVFENHWPPRFHRANPRKWKLVQISAGSKNLSINLSCQLSLSQNGKINFLSVITVLQNIVNCSETSIDEFTYVFYLFYLRTNMRKPKLSVVLKPQSMKLVRDVKINCYEFQNYNPTITILIVHYSMHARVLVKDFAMMSNQGEAKFISV